MHSTLKSPSYRCRPIKRCPGSITVSWPQSAVGDIIEYEHDRGTRDRSAKRHAESCDGACSSARAIGDAALTNGHDIRASIVISNQAKLMPLRGNESVGHESESHKHNQECVAVVQAHAQHINGFTRRSPQLHGRDVTEYWRAERCFKLHDNRQPQSQHSTASWC